MVGLTEKLTTECKGTKKEKKLEQLDKHLYFKLEVIIIWRWGKINNSHTGISLLIHVIIIKFNYSSIYIAPTVYTAQ